MASVPSVACVEDRILAGSAYEKLASGLKNIKYMFSSSKNSFFQILIKPVDKVLKMNLL